MNVDHLELWRVVRVLEESDTRLHRLVSHHESGKPLVVNFDRSKLLLKMEIFINRRGYSFKSTVNCLLYISHVKGQGFYMMLIGLGK